ncbi:MAG TPA: hypothetical protein VL403_14225 [Candidatus Kryptonia bacterium]|nr:hypothetical protein [Candidatus Kryptonia bacterium]
MELDAPIARRTFLRFAGLGAGLLTVSRLRLSPALAEVAQGALRNPPLQILSPTDARILGAIADRITFTGDASMPRFADTPGLTTIDTALRQLPRDTVTQLHYALLLFEFGPPLFALRLSKLTDLSDAAKDAYLSGWEHSSYELRRVAFRAVKNLSLLGYYSQDATWQGIHYQGPWVPRPRRVVIGES